MSLSQFNQNNQELKQIIQSGNQSERGNQLIVENTITNLQLSYINQLPKDANKDEVIAARKFAELNVDYCLLNRDLNKSVDQIQNSLIRLRGFYNDYRGVIQESENMYKYVSLNLLFLFSFNKSKEFYSALQLVPIDDLQNPFIKFVVELEKSAVIGNYSDILQSRQRSPNKDFDKFLDRIMDTIRFEKARSVEVAYKQLRVLEALQIFEMSSEQQLIDYINNQQLNEDIEYDWKIEGSFLTFQHKQQNNNVNQTNSWNLIKKTIEYGYELDKII